MFDELGFYTLAGAPESPRELIDEIRQAEDLGIGCAFISERFNIKEAATLSGAAAAASTQIQIATGATNHNTRHPIVTAAHATTMHRLTGGRYTLRPGPGTDPLVRRPAPPGPGRGIDPLVRALGLTPVTTAQLEDFVGIMRRLWHGEFVIGHDGPAGTDPPLFPPPSLC